MLAISITAIILLALWNTPSNEPLTFDVSLKFNYQGQTNGSFTLTYEWTSKNIANKSPGTYDITWSQDVVQAAGSPSLSIDHFIKDHFSTIIIEQGIWSVDSSGGWEINIQQLAGSFINVNYAIIGSNDTVNSFVISASVNKSLDSFTGDLSAYGVTNLSVTISAKITIPGNMLMGLINKTAELFRGLVSLVKGFVDYIVGTGSQLVQLFAS